MRLREIADLNKSKVMISNFLGYNKQARIGDGENHDELNLTSDYYPFFSTRRPRTNLLETNFAVRDILINNGLYMTETGTNPNAVNLVRFDIKTGTKETVVTDFCSPFARLISFGAFVVALEKFTEYGDSWYYPNQWFNTSETIPEKQHGETIKERVVNPANFSASLSVYYCDEEGEEIQFSSFGSSSPVGVEGAYWYDTSSYYSELKRGQVMRYYAGTNAGWYPVNDTYLRISTDDINRFEVGDYVYLNMLPTVEDHKTVVGATKDYIGKVYEVDEKNGDAFEVLKSVAATDAEKAYIVVKGNLVNTTDYRLDVEEDELTTIGFLRTDDGDTEGTVEFLLFEHLVGWIVVSQVNPPRMDYCFEANNRLWGCRFGTNNRFEKVNEIYASKLGSFKVWSQFKTIDSDSYIVSCGTHGKFTGGCEYQGNPIFFKEEFLHHGYGTYPFQVTPYKCNGVKDGSWDSIAMVDNVIYFHSRVGISYFDGALPHDIGLPFGDDSFGEGTLKNCIGAGTNAKYYMYAPNNGLYVYDVKKQILHKESAVITSMCSDGERIYAITTNTSGDFDYLSCLTHSALDFEHSYSGEDNFNWKADMCITGLDIANEKYVSQIQIRFDYGNGIIDTDDYIEVGVEYNRSGETKWVWRFPKVGESYTKEKNSFTVPIRVRRCDTMTLHLRGHGQMKIQSIAKVIEEGSDATRLVQV